MPSPAIDSQPDAAAALSTPALVVDLDLFEANVAAMAVLLRGTGKTLRPHVKAHRTPDLARRQLGGAAVGITCATVGEAEAMVEAGIDDVLVANEVVEPRKIARLAALARRASDRGRGGRPGAGGRALAGGDAHRGHGGRADRRRRPPAPLRRRIGRGSDRARGGDRALCGPAAARDHGLRGARAPGRRGSGRQDRRRLCGHGRRWWPPCAPLASSWTSSPALALRRFVKRWPTRPSPRSRPASTR